ncbi:isochorismatase family protein [Clostridium puniceum]|uniref:Isochorismatase family protein n=1 Tax=Clostridium puniceum TaxID=29367 RepID=A0A1S8TEJ6_9CLOT|nr:isochorismatase family cysteine hydrolase [Clostridium puniceum]OOM76203.1 isochorismatase family protein [Clostridium puniceum]
MKSIVTEDFINKSTKTLMNILESFNKLPVLKISELVGDTALIVIDMNNGFCNCGALYSSRIQALIPEVSRIAHEFSKNEDIPVVIVNEDHTKDSIEFNARPIHCVRGSEEAKIISELDDIENKVVVGKNSTNAFVSEKFKQVVAKLHMKGIRKFVFIGDCSDICIFHAAISMKTFFNEHNEEVEIIVPISAVDTYDLDIANHDGDLMNVVFLYSMMDNGIKVVKGLG